MERRMKEEPRRECATAELLGESPVWREGCSTLLRVLQEGEARRVGDTRMRRLDVRVISATHRGLEDAVAVGGFRADLYYRLNAVRLRLPPLRERGHDVLVLARHFIARAAAACGIDAPAIAPEPAL